MTTMRGMAVLAAAAGVVGTAGASTVSYTSNPGIEGLGAFTGSTTWNYLGANQGLLTITLTNTSPAANGGYLTGFAFRAVYNDSLKIAYASTYTNWSEITDENCNPWGTFDHGAAVGGNWLGGGQPSAGIAVGQTWSFAFDVRGDATLLSTLIAHDFFDESGGFGFVARFRGFEDGGSDKVSASLPTPGALALLALSALGARQRRR